MTYEDVTNVDSVGIVTARAGINVTGGNLTVDAFSNTANNYLSLRNGYVPSASGGMGFMSADHSGANADGIAIYGHDGISLYTEQTERLQITPAGRVRHQNSGGETIHELRRTDANTSGSVGTINFTASDSHSVGSISAVGDGDNEGAHLIFRTTSAAADNSPYNAATPERFRIDSSGNAILKSANLSLIHI